MRNNLLVALVAGFMVFAAIGCQRAPAPPQNTGGENKDGGAPFVAKELPLKGAPVPGPGGSTSNTPRTD